MDTNPGSHNQWDNVLCSNVDGYSSQMSYILSRGFEVARAASKLSNAKTSRKVGAALYAGGALLVVGHNWYRKTHPQAGSDFRNRHAEHHCLIQRQHYKGREGSHWVIYTYRELANGTPACSRPCMNCILRMREAGVSEVRFINENGAPDFMRIN